MFGEHISTEVMLFFILYGITGVVPLIAAVYLLLRRCNAFAPGVTPPVRLRRWAAAFFAVSVLDHVWWCLFYIYSGDIHSVSYVAVVLFDCLGLLPTIAGTLLAMLQDRKRPVWPVFVALIPYLALGVLQILYPDGPFTFIATVYALSLYVLFVVYITFAVRRYGRWLNDNYADLENKKVWLSQVVSLVFLLTFILYELIATYVFLIYLLHVVELIFFGLLLWRVETLPQLDTIAVEQQSQQPLDISSNIDLAKIERLLAEHCVGRQHYLQHDLTVRQLAKTVGTNRTYISLYFSHQNTTYNAYINDLRIHHFMRLYHEASAAQKNIVVQQLANDSGYRSYSTFSLAFKQRMGQSVTAWMRENKQ